MENFKKAKLILKILGSILLSIMLFSIFCVVFTIKNSQVTQSANEKYDSSLIEQCIKKAAAIENEIKKDPKNYKLYIERGKLKTPEIHPLFSTDKKNICNSVLYKNDTDNESAIADYKKALELNPKAYEAYELLFHAKKLSNGGTRKKPNYDSETLEYALKASEGNEDCEYFYYEISKIYKLRKDIENSEKYYQKAEDAHRRYIEKNKTKTLKPYNGPKYF